MLGEWILAILAGVFFLLVLFALVSFVIRIFSDAKPYKRHRR
jgi:hypothetical protein